MHKQNEDSTKQTEITLRSNAEIERAIIKKFRKDIWRKFTRALQDFKLIEQNDHVAVAISGGKDSLLMAKLLQEVQRHGQVDFRLSFIAMDPGFNRENRIGLEKNCEHLNIPVQIYDSKVFNVVDNMAKDYPCYLCARMRRGFLYEKAKALGANKLALGHHFDDIIETILLNVLYAGNYMTMMPKIDSTNFEDIQLIRPLYYIEEEHIHKWAKYSRLNPMDCGCAVAAGKISSKRQEVKDLIKTLKKTNPNVGKSILKSSQNVHLDAVLGYKTNGEKIDVLATRHKS